MRSILAALILSTLPLCAQADPVSDKLQSALDAYARGDLKAATLDIAMATGALAQQKQARIIALLPPAPDGWTLSVNEDYTANLAMAGGGAGTEATYTDASGNSLTVSITATSGGTSSGGRTIPGAIPFTRTAGPRATARFRTSASTAAFETAWGRWRGQAVVAATSETRRTAPPVSASASGHCRSHSSNRGSSPISPWNCSARILLPRRNAWCG